MFDNFAYLLLPLPTSVAFLSWSIEQYSYHHTVQHVQCMWQACISATIEMVVEIQRSKYSDFTWPTKTKQAPLNVVTII